MRGQLLTFSALTGILLVMSAFTRNAFWPIFAVLAAIFCWIFGIVVTVARKRWGWFVVVLLFGCIGSLAYEIFGPKSDNDSLIVVGTYESRKCYSVWFS